MNIEAKYNWFGIGAITGMALFGSILILTEVDLKSGHKKHACESELPRNQYCKTIAVPVKVKEDE